MYSELLFTLTNHEDRNMPLALDGLMATKIARKATNQAISEREAGSQKNHSQMIKAESIMSIIPADSSEPAPGLVPDQKETKAKDSPKKKKS